MLNSLWCLTTFFNPAGYASRLTNYNIFAENLAKQNVNLLTIELAFGSDKFSLSPSPNTIQIRSNSILWQKERLLNHAIYNILPSSCEYIAWIDGDIIFSNDDWGQMLIDKLQNAEVVQVFEQVKHLPPHHTSYQNQDVGTEKSIVWQAKNHHDWLSRRINWKLPYATVGFGWAARKSIFNKSQGMYDKHILGSNDNLVIDCCLNSFQIHHYWKNIHQELKSDMQEWIDKFGVNHSVDYLPVTIYHLFHGAKKYRGYIAREEVLRKHNYSPKTDIKLVDNVYEWNSNKPDLHLDCKNYFYNRKEDDDSIPDDPNSRL